MIIETITFPQANARSELKLEIDLWGRVTGMYQKLNNYLKIQFSMPLTAVQSLQVESGTQWRSFLAEAARHVLDAKGSRLSEFVTKQVEALGKE